MKSSAAIRAAGEMGASEMLSEGSRTTVVGEALRQTTVRAQEILGELESNICACRYSLVIYQLIVYFMTNEYYVNDITLRST